MFNGQPRIFMHQGGIPIMMNQQQMLPRPKGKKGAPIDPEYYNLLQVSPSCTLADIKKSYRRLAILHHPDKSGTRDVYDRLNKAYTVLSDEEKRICYDGFGVDYEKIEGIEMYIKKLRNDDIIIQLSVDLPDLLKGKEQKIEYRVKSGLLFQTRTHTFNIPGNTENGKQLVFHDIGHSTADDKLNGRVVVVIHEKEHKHFKRIGQILLHEKTIDFIDLWVNPVSKAIAIEHPKGHSFLITGVFQPLVWYCAEGQGCTESSPMFVRFVPNFPTALTTEQQKQLAQIFNRPIDLTHLTASTSYQAVKQVSENEVQTMLQKQAEENVSPLQHQASECRAQ